MTPNERTAGGLDDINMGSPMKPEALEQPHASHMRDLVQTQGLQSIMKPL